jgi:lactoylglutathione lyase
MRLAKQHLDIGLFTNDRDAHLTFWAQGVGLRLDLELPMAPGWVQYRYDANGSVVKVNHWADPLPKQQPSGFAGLFIARPDGHLASEHPDGDAVVVVPPGMGGVEGIAVTIASPQPARLLDFYCTAMEFEQAGPTSVRCGDSLLFLVEGDAVDTAELCAPGFRYLTAQVVDADAEMAGVVERGGRIAREPVSYAGVARYGFVADPDGNWIEISARTSLTGIEVS